MTARETLGIREAKAQLSRLVRRAQRGDSITLTHRGRPIARIVPITEPDESTEARIKELERRGWIQHQTDPPVALPEIVLEPDLAQRYLREDRDSR